MSAPFQLSLNSNGQNFGRADKIAAINCQTPRDYSANDTGKTFIADSIYTPQKSASATGSAATNIDGSVGIYYCDDTGGDVIINLGNPAILKDSKFYFKRIAAGGHNIKFYTFNGEKLELSATSPQTFLPTNKDHFCLTTDGTDWFIIA